MRNCTVHAISAVLILIIISCGADEPTSTRVISATVYSKEELDISSESEGVVTYSRQVGEQFSKGDILFQIDSSHDKRRLSLLKQHEESLNEKLSLQSKLTRKYGELRSSKVVSQQTATESLVSHLDTEIALHELKQSILELKYEISTKIVSAPFDGIVSENLVYKHEYVNTGDKLLTILNTENLFLQAKLPASHFRTSERSAVCFIIENDGTKLELDYLLPKINVSSNTMEASFKLPTSQFIIGEHVMLAFCTDNARSTGE